MNFLSPILAIHSSDPSPPSPPPLFLKGWEVNSDYLPQKGVVFKKFKKGGGITVQGQVFLKGGAGTFPI